jgi:hypothetical protein
MGTVRNEFTLTSVSSGAYAVAVAGYDASVWHSTAERFNASTLTWGAVSNTIIQRASHSATLLANGDVLIAGGHYSGPTYPTSSYTYSPTSNSFTATTGGLNTGRNNIMMALLLYDDKVLLAGGVQSTAMSNAELYDPVARTFATTTAMGTRRVHAGAVRIANGDVLVPGGQSSSGLPLTTAELYQRRPNGQGCTLVAQCGSGFCVDSVCCNDPCGGSCEACSAAKKGQGSDGTCGNVLAGQDPDSECPDDGAATCDRNGWCDGAGACQLYSVGTQCGAPSCAGGTLTSYACNGVGTCSPSASSCSPYVCASGSSCGSSCSDDGGCVASHYCAGDDTCQPDQAQGASCSSGSQCVSGNCVDGYCCDAACDTLCRACSNAKTGSPNGTCDDVIAGQDFDNECPDDGAASCDRNGQCDGAGACQLYAPGAVCGATTCSGGTQSGFSCDGFGTCVTGPTSCSPYLCADATQCATSCASDALCIASSYCRTSDGTCQPDQSNGATCTLGSQCISGNCVDGYCCDQQCGTLCKACAAAKTGGSNGTCSNVIAGADFDDECPDDGAASCDRNGLCNGAGACQLYASGTACLTTTCTAGTQTGYACNGLGACDPNVTTPCAPYVCGASACNTTCTDDAGCVSSHYCSAGSSCDPDEPNGAACNRAAQCQSGNCVDGFCCEAPCAGVCQACSQAKTGGANGACLPVTAGTDPDSECPDDGAASCDRNGLCSGSGACAIYTSSTACGATTCVGTTLTGYTCNGTGDCVSGSSGDCTPYLCGASACKTSCADDADCVTGAYCAASECKLDQANGADCTSGSQCISGNCVDGKCCDQTCTGPCKACSAAKKGAGLDGECENVAPGEDPDNDCAAQAPSTCGTTGACNVNGACQIHGQGTACGTTVCLDTATVSGLLCDGLGSCVTSAGSPCAPYFCKNDACSTSCADSSDCTSSHYCLGSTCTPKKADGEPCNGPVECQSPFCVAGICCNTACDGTCQSCAQASKQDDSPDGTCGMAKAGTDPQDDCPDDGAPSCDRDGTCDGVGGCRIYAGDSPCGTTDCDGNSLAGYFCDGAGTCASRAGQDCGDYRCVEPSGQPAACTTSCDGDEDCADDALCDAGACLPRAEDGTACSEARDCVSRHCVDGYCCDAPCGGQCEACNLAANPGVCSPVTGDPVGDRPPCPAASGSDPCDARACDGAQSRTECVGHVGIDTSCRDASCVDGVATLAEVCDGSGVCPEPRTIECVAYACAGDACGTDCANDDDCLAGNRCVDSACISGATCLDDFTVAEATGDTKDCKPYRCVSGACEDSCASTANCAPGHVCNQGACTPADPGAAEADEEGGCGCRTAGGAPRGAAGLIAALAVVLPSRRRRARPSSYGAARSSRLAT